MPLISVPPQELLALEITTNATSTSTATHGGALSTPISTSFTTGTRPIELDVQIPYASNGTAGGFAEIHILIDGTCRLEAFIYSAVGSIGGFLSRKRRITNLAAGSHTIAVQCKVGSGTGSLQFSSSNGTENPGSVLIREV